MKKLLLLACLLVGLKTTTVFSQESKENAKESAESTEAQKTQIKSEITGILNEIALSHENFVNIPKFVESLKKYTTKHTKFILENGNKISAENFEQLLSSGLFKISTYTSSDDEFDFVSPKLVILTRKVTISGSMRGTDFNNKSLVKFIFHNTKGGWKLLHRQATSLK
ncbi:MAG: hypothetical protein QM539_02040 [Alphaproteobacteria bacterium]|nr:hypothetical protein [Alphaproteobacteria bacterium]